MQKNNILAVWASYIIILMIQTKLFSDLRLIKFLDILDISIFFLHRKRIGLYVLRISIMQLISFDFILKLYIKWYHIQ